MVANQPFFLRILAILLFLPLVVLSGCGGGGDAVAVDATNGSVPVTAVLTANGIGEHGATLNGMVIPNGLSTEAWFEHGVDPSLSNFSSTSPLQSIGSGLDAVPVSDSIGGLADNTIHYFRVCASNTKGTSRSSIQNFTTSSSGSPPAVTTAAPTSVSMSTATLNGNVTPNGLATDVWFEWGTDTALSSFTGTLSQPVGSGTASQTVNAGLTGMATGTTYYYRVAAANSAGTTKGSILSFTPGAAPGVTTLAATSVGANTATLNGNVTANGLSTDAFFELSTENTLSSATNTASQPVGSGTTGQTVNAGLTALATGTTYYYRVVAGNSSGTTKGSILRFTPGAAPAATTLAATSVGVSTATLNGNVTANGLATESWFEWGTSSTLASFDNTAFQAVGSGSASQPVNAGLTGLAAGTAYYYRVAAKNSSGTTKGSIRSFTAGAAPAATTLAATSIGVSTATLDGSVMSNGLATDAWFEWGTSSTLASFDNTASQAVGSGTASQPVNAGLTGLSGGTTYYYRVAAANVSGTQKGAIVSFSTTLGTSAPISTSLQATLITTGAICNGKVNPNGLPSTAWFEWGTDPALSSFNASSSQSIGSGTTNKYMNEPLTGLSDGTTYYCRVAGANAKGTTRGTIQSFTAGTGTWGFFDDFSTDTTAGYAVFKGLGSESFIFDSTGENARVATGGGGTLVFSQSLPGGGTGSISLDFHPTKEYGSGGSIRVRLMDTPRTYYELSTADERIFKYRAGEEVDNVPFPVGYSQGGNYTIKVTFGPMVTTVEAFGRRDSMTLNQAANPVNYFEVWSNQQDASYDNIKLAIPP